MKLTKEQWNELYQKKLNNEDSVQFFHCKTCFEQSLKEHGTKNEAWSPKKTLSYELSAIPIKYPDGSTIGVVVAWCNRCEKSIWDSRHLFPIEDSE